MDYNEQQHAIARFCGWEFAERTRKRWGQLRPGTYPMCRHPVYTRGVWRTLSRLPEYPRDLNALQEAVESMDTKLYWDFCHALEALPQEGCGSPITAKASVRAMVLLKLIGKWKEVEQHEPANAGW